MAWSRKPASCAALSLFPNMFDWAYAAIIMAETFALVIIFFSSDFAKAGLRILVSSITNFANSASVSMAFHGPLLLGRAFDVVKLVRSANVPKTTSPELRRNIVQFPLGLD